MNPPDDLRIRLAGVGIFALAFGYVEASVVVYLRALYYPQGFAFPLNVLGHQHLSVELGREAATIVMLAAVAAVAGAKRWQRMGYFMVGFGIWDIAFYFWVWVILRWPASLVEWDILFLLPIPWIGPVVAPLLISLALIVCGGTIIVRSGRGIAFRPGALSWVLGASGTLLLLYSFMRDTPAALEGKLPQPYHYEYLAAGLVLCVTGWYLACRTHPRPIS